MGSRAGKVVDQVLLTVRITGRVFRPTIHPCKEQEFEAFLGGGFVYVTVWEDLESNPGVRRGALAGGCDHP